MNKRQKFATYAAIAAALLLIFSVGPNLQMYLVSLINSKVPSIYGSAFKQDLVRMPTLGAWLVAGISPQIVAAALTSAWWCLPASAARPLLVRIFGASLVLLSAVDIGNGIYYHQISPAWAFENSACNAIGGLLIGLVMIGFFAIAEALYVHAPMQRTARQSLGLIVLPISALALCVGIYYVIEFFYDPLPARLDAYFLAPSGGALAPAQSASPAKYSNATKQSSEDINREFSFYPDKDIHSQLTWVEPEGQISVDKTPIIGASETISIYLLSECMNPVDMVKMADKNSPWITLSGNSIFAAKIDKGPSDLFILPLKGATGHFHINTSSPTFFNIDKDEKSGNIKITRFVGENASVDFRKSGSNYAFILSAPLVKPEPSRIEFAKRIFVLKIGSDSRTLLVQPQVDINSKPTPCKIISPTSVINKGENSYFLRNAGSIMAVMAVVKPNEDSSGISTIESTIHATAPSGWVVAEDLQTSELDGEYLGKLNMLVLHGNISDLLIDDVPTQTHQVESYTAVGDLNAKYGAGGKIRVWGEVNSLWKDSGRLNSTKWERLGWEPKAFILGLLAAVIGYVGTFALRAIGANKQFSLLS